jgi:hypothetical protein
VNTSDSNARTREQVISRMPKTMLSSARASGGEQEAIDRWLRMSPAEQAALLKMFDGFDAALDAERKWTKAEAAVADFKRRHEERSKRDVAYMIRTILPGGMAPVRTRLGELEREVAACEREAARTRDALEGVVEAERRRAAAAGERIAAERQKQHERLMLTDPAYAATVNRFQESRARAKQEYARQAAVRKARQDAETTEWKREQAERARQAKLEAEHRAEARKARGWTGRRHDDLAAWITGHEPGKPPTCPRHKGHGALELFDGRWTCLSCLRSGYATSAWSEDELAQLRVAARTARGADVARLGVAVGAWWIGAAPMAVLMAGWLGGSKWQEWSGETEGGTGLFAFGMGALWVGGAVAALLGVPIPFLTERAP